MWAKAAVSDASGVHLPRCAQRDAPERALKNPAWRGGSRGRRQGCGLRADMLVERVVVGPAGADIRLRVAGLAGLVRDLGAGAPGATRAAT